jgi:hypothetical protein
VTLALTFLAYVLIGGAFAFLEICLLEAEGADLTAWPRGTLVRRLGLTVVAWPAIVVSVWVGVGVVLTAAAWARVAAWFEAQP